MQVRISKQVADYVRSLPPFQKRRIRAALKGLESLQGDLKDLQHPLEGYCRLRAFQFRLILKINLTTVDCIFIEKRPIVYEAFEQMMLR